MLLAIHSRKPHIGLQQSPAVQTSDAQVIVVVRSLSMPAMVPQRAGVRR